MNDTDMAGIIYFANQFRFAHEAWEDFIENEGIGLAHLLNNEDYIFVIRHVEGDYFTPLYVGDKLEVVLTVEHVGQHSFSTNYVIMRKSDGKKVGQAKIVHVTLCASSRTKIAIPESLQAILNKHKSG